MFKERKKLPKFVLAKTSSDTRHGYSKLGYKKKYELCTIIVLIFLIFVFRFSAHLDIQQYLVQSEIEEFEFLEITEIPPVVEPPKLQMEEVVEVIEEEKPEEESTEVDEIIEEIEEMLGDDSEEPQLALASASLDNNLLSNSQLGAIGRTRFQQRADLSLGDNNLSLGSEGRYVGENGGGLDIGTTQTKRRNLDVGAANLDLNIDKKPKAQPKRKRENENNGESSLNLEGKPVKVLSFASSTIGTEDYKLWNKIISELDRLNKGRYGSISDQIIRRGNGFIINFGFPDNSAQEINWRNDGNISIKVIGNSNKTTIQELQRALSSLLRMSL